MRSLTINDLKDIVVGATLLGSGGGGSPENGLMLVDEIAKVTESIPLVSPDEVGDNEYVSMIAGIGSPKALKEKGFGPQALYAFDTLQRLYELIGVKFKYIMPGETGGFNIVTPMYVAAHRKLALVDADGTGGRAVPELGTTLYNLYGIPNSPLILADRHGNSVVAWLANPLDGHMAETIARYVTVAFELTAAFGTWTMTGWQLKAFMEPGVVTRSLNVGRAIREAKEAGKDPVKAVVEVVRGFEIFRGTITKIETRTVGGFDFGRTIIEGEGEYAGRKLFIDFKNENMIVWNEKNEPLAMVPDLVCLMTIDGTPLTNADTKEGMKVAVLGIPASEKWRKHPKAFEVWKHILEKMGYTGEYVPIEKLVK